MSELGTGDRMPDRELVQRAVSPSSPDEREQALRSIYERHSADVLGLCGWWLSDPDVAMDAAQSTFEVAIEDLTGAGPSGTPTLRDPDRLGAWLRGIAKNQCRREWARRNREGEFPDEELEEAEHEVTASRRRQSQVDRMLDTVAASFTDRQQLIFQLVLRQGMRGRALAAELGASERAAYASTYENESLVIEGFGAYVLARDGRAHCPILARILDQAGWDGQTFTRVLRLRILRHLDNCKICDNCATCNVQKTRLIRPYTPVIIPLLISAVLRDQIYEFIHRICNPPGPAAPGPRTPRGPQATATAGAGSEAALDAVITSTGPSSRTRRNPRLARRALAGIAAIVIVIVVVVLVLPYVLHSHQTSARAASHGGGAALPPAIAYSTATSLMLRTGTGATRTLATFPTGQGGTGPEVAWSADGKELAWLDGNGVSLAQVGAGTTRRWACSECSGVAFQGEEVVTVLANTANGQPDTIPQLRVMSAGGSSPVTETIAGIPAGGSNTGMVLLGAIPPSTLVVAYGNITGSPGSRLRLYHVDPAGRATPYSDGATSKQVSGSPGEFATDPSGQHAAFTTATDGGGCGFDETTYMLNSITGVVTVPATPNGGGPDGFFTEGLWFDRNGTAYASFVPNLSDCTTTGNPVTANQPAQASPVVCKMVSGHWVAVGTGTIQAGYASDGWIARQIGTITASASTYTLVISHGTSTMTVPAVSTFVWAP